MYEMVQLCDIGKYKIEKIPPKTQEMLKKMEETLKKMQYLWKF